MARETWEGVRGASKTLKALMAYKGIRVKDLAEAFGKDHQYLSNALYKDTFNFKTVRKLADLLGYDLVFKDRETGQIFY